jgi:hypothetical protein
VPELGLRRDLRLRPPGTYTVLYALNRTADSSLPLGVIQASDGDLYGAAGTFRQGTVFKFQLSNSQFTTLYDFPSGIFPLNRVTQASNGLLYGSTRPTNATNGSFVVTIFSSGLTGNVQNPLQLTLPAKKLFAVGPFLQAADGNLRNTSYVGGTSGLGIAFAVFPMSSSSTKAISGRLLSKMNAASSMALSFQRIDLQVSWDNSFTSSGQPLPVLMDSCGRTANWP